jgi:hypothetical protein
MVSAPQAAVLAAAFGILLLLVLLVRLELRESAQWAELKALRTDVAALRADRPASESSAGGAPPVVLRSAIDSQTIHAIASAVVKLQSQQAAAASASAATPQTPPRSVEQETELAHASEVAVQAIAHGRLSRDDVLRMRKDLADANATAAERDALRSQIALAINAQRLKPESWAFVYP